MEKFNIKNWQDKKGHKRTLGQINEVSNYMRLKRTITLKDVKGKRVTLQKGMTGTHVRFGWDEDEAREFSNNAGFALEFQRLLFARVMPNLSRIGLLTDKVSPLYDQLGVLEFESHSNDGDISWAELEKPLDLSA